ncbi:heterocyst frequency control protein PatD [Geminocystis sp. CENA526]|uniref:heterocyst frequency control protein PatD n=1 Tax=Geminocystis sp. CENA526 TaxID=1355871 RepID=UPI003D6E6DE0
MLSKSHYEELLTWLELLRAYDLLWSNDPNNLGLLKQNLTQIQTYLETKIMLIDRTDLDPEARSIFQAWQTETHRYIRLLQTDFLFYQSAKQTKTKLDRILLIQQRLKLAIELTENYLTVIAK